MPKDKHTSSNESEKVEEAKKKMVVVEEVAVEEAPVVEKIDNAEAKIEETSKPVEQAEVLDDGNEEDYDKPNYLWIVVPTALLVGALVGGLITYFSGISKLNMPSVSPSPVASTEPEVKMTPSPEPKSDLKKDTVKIQILNGSGVSGAAGKVKTLLEGLGYKNIDTGNASSSDVATTEIATTESGSAYVSELIKDLSKSYDAKEASKLLPNTSKFDIVITLGKK